MADQQTPYWYLISVLFSTQPLTASLAMCLHQTAYELYKRNDAVGQVAGDLISGKVRNLRKEVLVGSVGGPAFEAEIETERGSGVVRFFLTRQGIELLEGKALEQTPVAPRPKYLN
ncbi:hypothetical protein P2318_16570 [Myxococcaceae bacterium GXIMD 01537]